MKNEGNINGEVLKQRERHIVSWSQEENDILREQIKIHGTENWAVIASNFKDKTIRQCRRRWYTYLNLNFKTGVWSPEEDMLLCEAQKIFGNRWTEIAKIVSGRTDNAVKNRFSTLCKKRKNNEALAKENTTSYINTNNKRTIVDGFNPAKLSETAISLKKMRRAPISDLTEKCNSGERLPGECGTTTNQKLRSPFAVLVQNFHDVGSVPTQHHVNNSKENPDDASNDKIQGTFLKKDDPRVLALMQQAKLLSSLAVKVNTENTDQSLENAWKVLQEFLYQSKGSDILGIKISDMDFQFECFKDLVDDLRSGSDCNQPSWRQPDLFEESPGSSDFIAGSTLISPTEGDKKKESLGMLCALHRITLVESQSIPIGDPNGIANCDNVLSGATSTQDMLPSCNGLNDYDGIVTFSSTEFGSLPVTPIFRSLAAGIPSPKFSESERQFLLKALRVESPSCNPSNVASSPPPCKRALLQNL